MGIGSSFRSGEVLGYGFGGRGEIIWMVVLVYNNKVFKNMQDLANHGILKTWYEIC